jgi:hypothetical protein
MAERKVRFREYSRPIVLNVSSSDFDPIAAPCNHVTGVRFQPITDVGYWHLYSAGPSSP